MLHLGRTLDGLWLVEVSLQHQAATAVTKCTTHSVVAAKLFSDEETLPYNASVESAHGLQRTSLSLMPPRERTALANSLRILLCRYSDQCELKQARFVPLQVSCVHT